MMRPALRTAAVPRRAIPAARHSAWEAVWRQQFNTRRPLSTKPSQSPGKTTGASQFTTRRAYTYNWSWMTARLETMFRTSRRGFRFSARNGSKADATPAKESLSLSQRLKKLSKEYGWSAVGVYFALSILDFPFCFLLVRIVGTDRIGELEHWLMSNIKKVIPESVKTWWHDYRAAFKKAETEQFGNDDMSDTVEMAGWGVEEAQARNRAEASLGTQLALAYAIHKSFIFLRVPLTAAVTPKVVKVLRSWGWQIGKRRSK
ncbi:peptide alpha-n-acetyltransferase nat2 [Colletotrichum karsti]|uniref:Peptide alpha-n-acetyltransferase nat2 n=1 Tax=Colletotrichum karsti TaxID=1095194 RepID=A0A9P6LR78_9PEZI|nr:peptide alpha-n-acetyltransferase nat2 [Colletotrichum karsti]KAF9882077.1 peptide alpha-n-acetyltransferase nat2 [Colletotrichum karsti]